jgi:hypothetical protein
MINHQQIKPAANGRSDFFSWQLYRWVKKHPGRLKIWAGTWNSCTGIDREKPVLYIGDDRDGDWIHARQLRNLCTHGANLQAWAYGPPHDTKNWVDATEAFWGDYLKKGVCAIHGDFAHDWDDQGQRRACNYCGAVETKETRTRTVTTEVWVAA